MRKVNNDNNNDNNNNDNNNNDNNNVDITKNIIVLYFSSFFLHLGRFLYRNTSLDIYLPFLQSAFLFKK